MYQQLLRCKLKYMPTYNYYCKKCDIHFSYFQKMNDPPYSHCEECNGEINRIISGGTGLIFKGSGFYLTDYKNKPENSSVSSDKKIDKKVDGKTKKVVKKSNNKKENNTNE